MSNYVVETFVKENGKDPVKDFILKLPSKMQAKILRVLDLLEEYEEGVKYAYSKHLDEEIFGIRIKFASDIVRILYFFAVENKIVLTNGFVKKTQKTPIREIRLA